MITLVVATLLAAEPGAGAPEPLADPSVAVEWILADAPPPPPAADAAPWDGALGAAAIRGLFGMYRTIFSSQDSEVCGFTPSCSRFSQLAIARAGFVRGVLLTADRLLRDHPLAPGFYDSDPATGLLSDDPDRYDPEVRR